MITQMERNLGDLQAGKEHTFVEVTTEVIDG